MGGWGATRSNMDSSNVLFLLLIGGNWFERIRKKRAGGLREQIIIRREKKRKSALHPKKISVLNSIRGDCNQIF